MDELVQLRCHNAALETELRLVKEQLAQAHMSTQYLLSSLSGQHAAAEPNTEIHLAQMEHRATWEENRQLKTFLRMRGNAPSNEANKRAHPSLDEETHEPTAADLKDEPSRSQAVLRTIWNENTQLKALLRVNGCLPLKETHMTGGALPTSSADAQRHDANEEDLMSFDDCISEAAEPSPKLVESLEASKVNPVSAPQLRSNDRRLVQTTDPIRNALIISREPAPLAPPTPSPRPVRSLRSRFDWGEHNRLDGGACYVEDKDADEKKAHWLRLAREGRGQTAQQWQEYYEECVRPAYLLKLQREVGPLRGKTSTQDADAHDPNDTMLLVQGIVGEGVDGSTESFSAENHAKVPPNSPTPGTDANGHIQCPFEDVEAVDEDCSPHYIEPRTSEVPGELAAAPVGFQICTAFDRSQVVSGPAYYSSDKTISSLWSIRSPMDPYQRRMVEISRIPADTLLADVLDRVRGGPVVAAEYYDLSSLIKGKDALNLVRVTFLYGQDAAKYVEYCKNHRFPDCGTALDNSMDWAVTLLPRPTPRLSPQLAAHLKHYSCSRVLSILNAGHLSTADVVSRVITRRPPLSHGRNEAIKSLWFVFASMDEAAEFSMKLYQNPSVFGAYAREYLPDPCGQPVETLGQVFAHDLGETETQSGGAFEAQGGAVGDESEDYSKADVDRGHDAEERQVAETATAEKVSTGACTAAANDVEEDEIDQSRVQADTGFNTWLKPKYSYSLAANDQDEANGNEEAVPRALQARNQSNAMGGDLELAKQMAEDYKRSSGRVRR